jgi:ethanolamine ammonia-lyase small subunit
MTSVLDPWGHVRSLTPARVALGRSGVSLPTQRVLELSLAHARARDAVHRPLDVAGLLTRLPGGVAVTSEASDRATYLRRPDLGRRLGASDSLVGLHGDVALVLADGLSPGAVEAFAPPVLDALLPILERAGLGASVPIVATQARVALGDHVAAAIGARAVIVLIGERPGLSVPASLGAYLTWEPTPGVTTDADRNCVSNIQPDGLSPAEAARRIAWLLLAARDTGRSGVSLKDESEGASLLANDPSTAPTRLS